MYLVAGHAGVGTVYTERLIPSLLKISPALVFLGWDRGVESGAWPFECRREILLQGGGYKNLGLVWRYANWVGRVRTRLRDIPPTSLVLALDLDSALGAALARGRNGTRLIYFVLDNFALRPMVPRMLRPWISRVDQWVMHQASHVVVPDLSRLTAAEMSSVNFVVIRNAAVDISDDMTSQQRAFPFESPLTVYASGYLSNSRGIGWLLRVARSLPEVNIRMAGTIVDKDVLRTIGEMSNVTFLGRIPFKRSLEECFGAHVIYAMYDPAEPLNRLAASNKWSDAMMAGRPVLCNLEIESARMVRQEDIGYCIPYGDDSALEKALQEIGRNRHVAAAKGQRARVLFEREWSWEESERRLRAMLEAPV